MTTAIRTALTAARARRTARHLAQVRFCDGRGQVCDSSCRATAHRERTQLTVLSAR
ncbi:hypothetical protein [Streptomyces sp. AM8-1-1]|uniref:hypothetical protein n=1 Tax=Streptomyces sp. AM8-1-1 TaxID=3075825 RepID=UPI0028C3834F|nr:hypothetical protein [Streptomyces sp. AM8-1-1]WNO70197.1 hypothetical protein RPQ07_00460 [Streptomyces sp. AM8-1-1]